MFTLSVYCYLDNIVFVQVCEVSVFVSRLVRF